MIVVVVVVVVVTCFTSNLREACRVQYCERFPFDETTRWPFEVWAAFVGGSARVANTFAHEFLGLFCCWLSCP